MAEADYAAGEIGKAEADRATGEPDLVEVDFTAREPGVAEDDCSRRSWRPGSRLGPPEKSARRKSTVPPVNRAWRKLTVPPENLARLKSPPSKMMPEKSKFRPCQDTASSSLRCAVMTRMTVWRTSRLAWKAALRLRSVLAGVRLYGIRR